jgi:hypothetical protein
MKTKTDRVVLNLQQKEAQYMAAAMQNIAESYKENCYEKELAAKISRQLNKTVAKNQAIDNLRKTGPEPTKEEVDKAMIAAGVKIPKAVPKKQMKAIADAVTEVGKELNEGTKCPSCDGIMLPEPDGTLSCEFCGAIL